MQATRQSPTAHPAIVARHVHDAAGAEEYLVLSPQGATPWTADPRIATAFASMRDATRAALRLSGARRGFGLPLRTELGALAAH